MNSTTTRSGRGGNGPFFLNGIGRGFENGIQKFRIQTAGGDRGRGSTARARRGGARAAPGLAGAYAVVSQSIRSISAVTDPAGDRRRDWVGIVCGARALRI